MSFVGKDTLALCKQMRETNALTDEDPIAFAAFIRHVSTDPLIGFAFTAMTKSCASCTRRANGTA